MIKTGHQIEGDMFALLKDSTLLASVSGSLYRNGTRPRDSKMEDVVVIFTTSTATQVQNGVVTLNLYVPDIRNSASGVTVEDIARTQELEGAMATFVDGLTASRSEYLFSLKEAIHTQRDADIEQSFIVARLSFKRLA